MSIIESMFPSSSVNFAGLLHYHVMQNAFIAGTIIAILAGTVGYFMVVRGQSFAGHSLANVGFAGATGASLIGLSPLLGLVVSGILAAYGIYWLGLDMQHSRQSDIGFDFRLPDGRHPAELAALDLVKGAGITELISVTKSIQDTRFVMAIVTMVMAGKGVYLKLQNEEFEVSSRILCQALRKDDALCAHILPVSRGKWLVCPGWLIWPTRFGPGIRSRLKEFQIDPIKLERFLQQRTSAPEERPRIPYPQDNTLGEAVARMSEAAKADGKDKLVRSKEEWNTLVLTNMKSNNFNKFTKDITKWVGNVSSLDDLNRWLAMATNIWNNVPQPDRGNRTANEMVAEERSFLDEQDGVG